MSRYVVATPKAPEFKVGDRVVVVHDDFPENIGALGTVQFRRGDEWMPADSDYAVLMDRPIRAWASPDKLVADLNDEVWFAETDLRRLAPAKTAATEKPTPSQPRLPLDDDSFTTLTLRRKGKFIVRTAGTDGANHCGLEAEQKVKYEVAIECASPVSLDSRGFLFEQRNVQKFFDNLGTTGLSCELLSTYCAEGLMAAVMKENPSCRVRRVTVMLSPKPYLASMTCEWVSLRADA